MAVVRRASVPVSRDGPSVPPSFRVGVALSVAARGRGTHVRCVRRSLRARSQGSIGQAYNRRKRRSGAFWSGRFHPALIQSGSHLSRCLFYIGLNVIRARVVAHPAEWSECGVHEPPGERKRYLSIERLLWCLGLPGDGDGFRRWYRSTLDEVSQATYRVREPLWAECVAVGSREWVEASGSRLVVGRRAIRQLRTPEALVVAEGEPSYGLHASRRAADGLLSAPGYQSGTAEN